MLYEFVDPEVVEVAIATMAVVSICLIPAVGMYAVYRLGLKDENWKDKEPDEWECWS